MRGLPAVLLWLLPGLTLFADDRVERLTPDHRKWLEEEVVYIITEEERDAFLSIENVEVRERFIEAFWKRRDPNPATLANELKDEHYRRLQYANEVLGRETGRPGWKTDRGRFYILLGAPREIQRYDRNELVPIELWFYEGDTTRGLPPFFYLLFFQRRAVGEFELYQPSFDGPTALVQSAQAEASTDRGALEALREVSVELARASLSFDPAERAYDAGSISSAGTDVLLARIEEAPKRKVRTDYLDAWRRYGRRVSADYSFNYVPNRATFVVLAGPQDTSFVHYSIEIDPQNFNLETDEKGTKFYTVVELGLEIRSSNGRLVVAKEREIFFQLNRSQFDQVKASPVAIQGVFPVVSGVNGVSVIARNRVLKQYTVAEGEIRVGRISRQEPGLTDLVLGFRNELVAGGREGEVRPFQVGSQVVHPAADGVFALGETVHVLSQAYGVEPDYRVRFRLVGPTGILKEWEFAIDRYQGGPIVESLPLDEIEVAGSYELRMTLLDPAGRTIAEKSAPVLVSPRAGIARASYLSREGFNAAAPGLLALERGEQLLNLGRRQEAMKELESAVAADNPDLPMARWKLAAILVASGEADRTLELLTPLEERFPQQFEVVAGLGFAFYQRHEWDKGRSYLERAMRLGAPYPALLNALADCYERTGRDDSALQTFERSLELDADQPLVKERIAALRSHH